LNLNGYLMTSYKQGARGPHQFDCWGLVRDILLNHYHVPDDHIPAFGHVPDRKEELTKCKAQIEHYFRKVSPVEGAIACHVRRGILFHVGVVVPFNGGLAVLHTSNKWGPSIDSLTKFNKLNAAEYYQHDDC